MGGHSVLGIISTTDWSAVLGTYRLYICMDLFISQSLCKNMCFNCSSCYDGVMSTHACRHGSLCCVASGHRG